MDIEPLCPHLNLESDASNGTRYKCSTCGLGMGATEGSLPATVDAKVSPVLGEAPIKQPVRKSIWFVLAGVVVLLLVLLVAKGAGGGTSSGGISGGSNASEFVNPENRSLMRINGLDVYDSAGNSLTLSQFASNYLSMLDARLGTQATSDQVAVGLESGNSLYGALHQFFDNEDAISVVGQEMQKDAAH